MLLSVKCSGKKYGCRYDIMVLDSITRGHCAAPLGPLYNSCHVTESLESSASRVPLSLNYLFPSFQQLTAHFVFPLNVDIMSVDHTNSIQAAVSSVATC